MNEEWRKLYDAAMKVINPCEVSENIFIGSVGAAVLTSKGNIVTNKFRFVENDPPNL